MYNLQFVMQKSQARGQQHNRDCQGHAYEQATSVAN
jgi:hypothetical protein